MQFLSAIAARQLPATFQNTLCDRKIARPSSHDLCWPSSSALPVGEKWAPEFLKSGLLSFLPQKMPQKMPEKKMLPTKQPAAKKIGVWIELRRYNWFRRCAMRRSAGVPCHTPAEFQLKWSQILLRPNLHLLKHIFYLSIFSSGFQNLQTHSSMLPWAGLVFFDTSCSDIQPYVCLGYVYPSTHITQHGTCCKHWTLAMSWM